MAIERSHPIPFSPKGLCDAYDASQAFSGACLQLSNLIFDQSNPELVIARPGVIQLALFNPAYAGATNITAFAVIGTRVYGMVSQTLLPGVDLPFIYNLDTQSFSFIGGTNAYPSTQPTTGPWVPPTISNVGVMIIVTHPGFNSTSAKFGWFDVSNYAAPTWNVGTTATHGLPSIPIAAANFNNRIWFAVGASSSSPANQLWYSDALTNPPTITNASQFLVIGDNEAITALSGLPITTTSSGIAQALLAFKATQIWQITGDTTFTTDPLAQNYLSLTIGTASPRSLAQTAYGVYFAGLTGPYLVDQTGVVRAITHDGENPNPDVIQPFLLCSNPSRVCAAYTGSTYRICMDTTFNGYPGRYDFWFDEHYRRWNGPHSVSYDCADAYGNTFILASNAYPAQLIASNPAPGAQYPSTVTFYVDFAFTTYSCLLQSASFPKAMPQSIKQVAECTIELGLNASAGAVSGSVTYDVVAQTEQGVTLGEVFMTVTPTGNLWGNFKWGDGTLWSSTINVPTTYAVPWGAPFVFDKMQLKISVAAQGGVKIGTFYARWQEAGYQTTNIPSQFSYVAPTGGSGVGFGTVLSGTPGALAYYSAATSISSASSALATAYLSVFTTALKGLVPAPGSINNYFLRDDGTWQPGAGGGGSGTVSSSLANQIAYYAVNGTTVTGETLIQALNMPALTGAVTSIAGTVATTLAPGVVLVGNMDQNAPAESFLGNPNPILIGAGPTQWCLFSDVTPYIAIFNQTVSGAVPATGVISGNFLRDDGTWEPIAGSSFAPAGTFVGNLTGAPLVALNYELSTLTLTTYTANVTLARYSDNVVFLNANAGSFIVTLPFANNSTGVGTKCLRLKRTDSNVANTVTVVRNPASVTDVIEGATSFLLLPDSSVDLQSDGNHSFYYC